MPVLSSAKAPPTPSPPEAFAGASVGVKRQSELQQTVWQRVLHAVHHGCQAEKSLQIALFRNSMLVMGRGVGRKSHAVLQSGGEWDTVSPA